jgi:hypothetical protein
MATDERYEEILRMLTVLYKRVDDLEKEVKDGFKTASSHTYLDELRREADKLI